MLPPRDYFGGIPTPSTPGVGEGVEPLELSHPAGSVNFELSGMISQD